MSSVQLNIPDSAGAKISTVLLGDEQHQQIVVEKLVAGVPTAIDSDNPLPIVQTGTPELPTGAATSANQQTDALTDIELRATPVPISGTVTTGGLTDAQLRAVAVPISGTVTANTGLTQPLTDLELRATPVPVSGTVTATPTGTQNVDVTANTIGLATATKQDTGNTSLGTIAGAISGTEMQVDVLTLPAVTIAAAQTLATVTTVGAVTGITNALPAGTNNIGDVDIASIAAGDNNIGNVDIVTMPNVVVGSGTITTITNTVPTKEVRSSTPAQSSPSVTNASTSILASNANRLGATIYNEGTAICYMKLGGTASVTSYSIQIAVGGYYEVPFGYTGAIDGITSASTAQLRVTELTT